MEMTVLTVAISLRCTVQRRQDPDHKKGGLVLEFADRQTDAVGRVLREKYKNLTLQQTQGGHSIPAAPRLNW